MGHYQTAQVCLNGHTITSSLETTSTLGAKFCDQCGAETICVCPSCNAKIRGYYHMDGVIGGFGYSPPNFCFSCGKAFPWTVSKLEAAKELADEFDELTADERKKLKGAIDDLVQNSPKTEVAAVRYKKIVKKLGAGTASALREVLIDVLSEAVKKSLFGGS